MKEKVVQRVIEGMEKSLEPCQYVINKIYNWNMNSLFVWGQSQDPADLTKLEDRLAVELKQAAKYIAIYLDMLGLTDTRTDFLVQWEKLGSDYGKTEWIDEYDHVQSIPLNLLYNYYNALRLTAEPNSPESLEKDPLHKLLEYTLHCTALVMKNFGKKPTREHDIQEVMNKHLETVFSDYVTNITINKPISGFRPDGGVISLKSAIEFKFCDNMDAVKEAFRGITEDLSGYAGSHDWTTFYSVVYQTEAFTTEHRFQKSLRLTGNAEKWIVIVVTGG